MVLSLFPITAFAAEITSIEFKPETPIQIYFETQGKVRTDNAGVEYFYYNGATGYSTGDTLTVNYDDGSSVDYVATYNDEKREMEFVADNGDVISGKDVSTRDEQEEHHWTLYGDNYFYIVYNTFTSKVNVKIILNPVDAIRFVPAGEYTVIENTKGEWRTDDGGEYFDYYIPDFIEGDELYVDFNDIDTTVKYKYSEEEGKFIDEQGNELEGSLYTVHEGSNRWEVGSKNNYFTVKYYDRESERVYVNVIENPVSKITFTKAKNYEYIVGTNMYYAPWDDTYYYNVPNFDEGDELTVYDKNNNPTTYTFTGDWWDGQFVSAGGEVIKSKDVTISDNQSNTPWTLGDNECTVNYLGSEATFTVKLINNPVDSIEYTPAQYRSYLEETCGWWSEHEGGEKYYYYSTPYYEKFDVLTVHYNDGRGTVQYSYVYDYENHINDYIADNGDRIPAEDVLIESNQDKQPWTVGVNYYTVTYSGKTAQVPVEIRKNTVEAISFTPAKTPEVVEGTEVFDPMFGKKVYKIPPIQEGDVFTVTYNDGRGDVAYTAQRDAQSGAINFVSADGDVIKTEENDDFYYYSQQWSTPWTVGGENYYTIEYCEKTCNVPVIVVSDHEHNYVAAVTAPTCTAKGFTTYTCSVCGGSYVADYTDIIPHVPVADKAVAATFKAAGKTAGTHCKNCGAVLTAQKAVAKLVSPTVSKLTAGKKAFTATWKKASTVDGYQVQYADNAKFKKAKSVTVKKDKTTKTTVKKLKAKKKYYVRVRAYKTINGKKVYSAWSKSKTVTTKK